MIVNDNMNTEFIQNLHSFVLNPQDVGYIRSVAKEPSVHSQPTRTRNI